MQKQKQPVVVFIIEDDVDDRLFLQYELEDRGAEIVVHFFSGVEELFDFQDAPREAANGRSVSQPAAIFVNPFMKSQDIRQAVALMKSREALRRVPQILMLGAANEEEFLRPYRLDVSGYMVKPVTLQALQQFIPPPIA